MKRRLLPILALLMLPAVALADTIGTPAGGGSVTGTNISVGSATLPDPAITINNSSAGQGCIFGNNTSSWCFLGDGSTQISGSGTSRFKVNNTDGHFYAPDANGYFKQYEAITTVGDGVAFEVAEINSTTQAANIASATLYAVPASGAGLYRAHCYVVVTQAATTSSTMPQCQVGWTDSDSGVAIANTSFTPTSTGNTAGLTNSISCPATCTQPPASSSQTLVFYAKASTNITYATTGYVSSGATSMQYAVHVRLEKLGS